jgi:hypothetical protein
MGAAHRSRPSDIASFGVVRASRMTSTMSFGVTVHRCRPFGLDRRGEKSILKL